MNSKKLLFLGVLVFSEATLAVSLRFADYPVDRIYKGDIVLPQFKGRDKAWREYRSRISEGMSEGVDYAGDMSIVQIGCGTGCSFITLGNLRNGKLYNFPRGGEDSLYLQVLAKPASKLLAAQWQGDDGCHLEHYLWTGKGLKRLSDRKLDSEELCKQDIEDALR